VWYVVRRNLRRSAEGEIWRFFLFDSERRGWGSDGPTGRVKVGLDGDWVLKLNL
jgi:hypothetical protein